MKLPASDLTLENRLLLLCARLELDAAEQEALRQISNEAVDWNQVVMAAIHHGIPTLLSYHLRGLEGRPTTIPRDVWGRLESMYRVARLQAMRQRFECGRLLKALTAEDVPVIPLKGIALRETIYPDPALRLSGDIDLLLPPEAIERVEGILSSLDYLPVERGGPKSHYQPDFSHHLVPYRLPERDVQVEIHWGLAAPDYASRIDMPALWRRARCGYLAGQPVQLLAAEDLLLHLVLHTIAWNTDELLQPLVRLRHLVDIAETVRYYRACLDWKALTARAREWGVEKHLSVAFELSRDLLGLDNPDLRLPTFQPMDYDPALSKAVRWGMLWLTEVKTPPPIPETLLHYKLAKTWQEKLRLICLTLLPSRQRLARRYGLPPDSARLFVCYWLLPLTLLQNYVQARWQAGRSRQYPFRGG